MNASYQVGLGLLPDHLRGQLERLVPPEWIFDLRPLPAGEPRKKRL